MATRQVKGRVSLEQRRAINEAMKEAGMKPSDFYRFCFQVGVETQGIEWPEDMPTHGGDRHKKAEVTS